MSLEILNVISEQYQSNNEYLLSNATTNACSKAFEKIQISKGQIWAKFEKNNYL